MAYNLTETQKKLARFLVEQVQAGNLPGSFHASESPARSGELLLSDVRHGMSLGEQVPTLLREFIPWRIAIITSWALRHGHKHVLSIDVDLNLQEARRR